MISPPTSEDELLSRCRTIEGLTISQLAQKANVHLPMSALQRKGWVGQVIERLLGAQAGSRSEPDFMGLNIELKTVPINAIGRPAESTFITTIPLLTVHQQTWETSQCFAKLRRVLWMPIESDVTIEFWHRRVGQAVLWSPSEEEQIVLENDWLQLTTMIGTGKLEHVDARIGQYLQVRPKAANAHSLCYGFDEKGNKIRTLPRGFYLRAQFTATIF